LCGNREDGRLAGAASQDGHLCWDARYKSPAVKKATAVASFASRALAHQAATSSISVGSSSPILALLTRLDGDAS
jgi:hypothetical protein